MTTRGNHWASSPHTICRSYPEILRPNLQIAISGHEFLPTWSSLDLSTPATTWAVCMAFPIYRTLNAVYGEEGGAETRRLSGRSGVALL